ncbi:FAD dependent oxidoreductase-domain-containing protein [Xylariaceae sp. FL0804]|nr:FAD dependent oxidoreductase-domain-containing protein [Xylariaceae sp. FL0804]
MSTPEDLLHQHEGQIIPGSFFAGYIVLSFFVSFIGAASTLELLNHRTSRNGLGNHALLLGAALTMGDISIWSMHFVGNRAVILANGQAEFQIDYSGGFTTLSFFLPSIVLLCAFEATGAKSTISTWRICAGGTLAGAAICGMHYVGNASISNYTCEYSPVYVVGAALISVFASITALAIFFVFQASWQQSWWKRLLSAAVLACAVSGMHWCASVGTQYRLLKLNKKDPVSRNQIVIVVACLSIGAALVIAGGAIRATRRAWMYASKAQQVVLAAAVFDSAGRILVSPDGLLPSEKITDTYIERTPNDIFSVANPFFHWMFQASRNWGSVSRLMTDTTHHLARLQRSDRDGEIRLIGEDGQIDPNYDVILRQLFCVAAANLADRLKEQLRHVGILWDEILPTGRNTWKGSRARPSDDSRLTEEGQSWETTRSEEGRGSLMFLVRRLEHTRDVEKLEAAGFRFAEIHQVCGIIGSSMQIKTANLKGKLAHMASYAEQKMTLEPVVHVGFFGVKPSVGGSGFNVLVRRGAKNLLPAVHMPIDRLDQGHLELLRQYDGVRVADLGRSLNSPSKRTPEETLFVSQLSEALKNLREWINEPIFDDAVLTSKVVQAPCRGQAGSDRAQSCDLIAFRLIIPVHASVQSPRCEFTPLSFFKVQQLAQKNEAHHAAFCRSIPQALTPNGYAAAIDVPGEVYLSGRRSPEDSGLRPHSIKQMMRRLVARQTTRSHDVDTSLAERKLSNGSTQSTVELCKSAGRSGTDASSSLHRSQSIGRKSEPGLDGIMVSQEVKVDRGTRGNTGRCGRWTCNGAAWRQDGLGTALASEEDRRGVERLKAVCDYANTRLSVQVLDAAAPAGVVPTMADSTHPTPNCWSRPTSSVLFSTSRPSSTRASHPTPRLAAPASVAAIGGGVLLYTYRPLNIPGFEGAAVPPPIYGPDGTFRLPRFPKVKSREEQIAELKRSGVKDGEEYDMLVIGGGATGAGVALDAVTRGLKVALVERDDFSSGTSSKSTKLVHGGVRYLEKAVWNLDWNQYQLVREALKERKYFLQTAPHLSMWLPIMLPLDKWWKAPYYWAGTKFYDFLAGSEGIESSYFLTRSKALDAFPMLKQQDLVGALVYYDGAHNDSRMNVSIAMTAALYGANVLNHAEVTGLMKNEKGKLCGATIKDRVPERSGRSAQDVTVRAKSIINCTGPFCDSIRKMDDQECKEIVAPASGVHVILPGYYSPAKMGLIDPKTSDGRVIFFLPWQGNTIAGTTDAPAKVTQTPLPDEPSIQWILHEISHYLSPDIKVRRGDVLAAWSGLRPLVKDPKAANTESLVRNHLIDVSDSGLVTCAGGKWTTYRQMAEECVDEAIKEFNLPTKPYPNAPRVSGTEAIDDGAILDGSCQTHNVRLIGAHGFSKTLFINLIQVFGLETEVAKHLTESYGDRAWTVASMCQETNMRFPVRGERIANMYPFVDGEIRYAVHHEYAQTAVDILARRTRLAFLNAQAALECLPRIIDIMTQELHWDKTRQDREWKDTVAFLESMGLPQPMLKSTRADVEKGKLDFSSSLEYQMYSRHDKPAVDEEVLKVRDEP